MGKPIAICIPVHNEERFLADTISSVLDQTFEDFDLIISENHSTDSTAEIIKEFQARDSRVKCWQPEYFCNAAANGRYLFKRVFQLDYTSTVSLGGHDLISNRYLELLYSAYQANPGAAIVAGSGIEIDASGNKLRDWPLTVQLKGGLVNVRPLIVLQSLVHNIAIYGLQPTRIRKAAKARHDCMGVDHLCVAEASLHGDIIVEPEAVLSLRRTEDFGNLDAYFKKHISDDMQAESIVADFEKQLEWVCHINDLAFANSSDVIKNINLACALGSYFTRYVGSFGMVSGALEMWLNSDSGRNIAIRLSDIGNIFKTQNVNKTTSHLSPALTQINPSTPIKSTVRIAGEGETGKDLTKIQEGSSFENGLRSLILAVQPKSIIETGTYLGTGTTRIIASALREAGLEQTQFFTIECNPLHHNHAVNNLTQNGLIQFVTPLLGLSVPRSLLPDMDRIKEETVTNVEGDNIFVDHQEANRVSYYYKETDFSDIPEDLLGNCLATLDNRPSLVLLDSAGHLGNVEFNYLVGKLKGECYVVLDDVYHIKHHKSFQQIKQDSRFTLITSSDEKFGFCIARFNPRAEVESPVKKKRILWVRTDSIGDNILSMAMLPHLKARRPDAEIIVFCQEHIADLYEACPVVDRVITFNRIRALQDEGYRTAILHQIQGLQADICLNSVYSREPLTDFFAAGSGALERIALQGDCSNISMEDLMNNNRLYTSIVSTANGRKPELERHQDFLRGIGITGERLEPAMWLHPDDIAFSDRFFKEHSLEPEKTIALFAGAQHSVRLYEKYGTALAQICRENGFSVVAFGSVNDYGINQQNLDAIGETTVNLSGTTTLVQSAALLSRCRLAVGAETGLAHTACAVGTPNVILLGGGHFGRFMPYSPLTSVACLPLECYGCNWQCRYTRVHCVRDVKPVVIEEAIRQTLAVMSVKPRVFVQDASNLRLEVSEPRWADMNKWLMNDSVSIIPVT